MKLRQRFTRKSTVRRRVKGAFTGAVANKPGRFQLADGGTLFLDEIGDLSPKGQGDLLRVSRRARSGWWAVRN